MKLGFVVIYVADVKEVMAFYQKAFDLKVRMEHQVDDHVLYGEMETEGAVLGFASHTLGQVNLNGNYQKVSANEKPFGQELVFVTANVQDVFTRAINAGAIEVAPPEEKPWGQITAFLRATEGTLIELCSPMNSESN